MKESKKYIFLTLIVLLTISVLSPLFANERVIDTAISLEKKGLSPFLITGLISMLPIFELRGGIPVGIAVFNMNPLLVYLLAVTFNLIPVFPVLLFLNPIKRFFLRLGLFKRFFDFLDRKAEKNKSIVEKYEELGLALFVAIPLPITGAWTGSLIAIVMGLNIYKSFLYIAIGILFAGVIVTLLTVLGNLGVILAIVLLSFFIVLYIVKIVSNKKNKV